MFNRYNVKSDEQKELEILLNNSKAKFSKTDTYVEFEPSPHLKTSEYGTKLIDTVLLKDILEVKSLQGIFNLDEKVLKLSLNNKIQHHFIRAAITAWSDHYAFSIKPIDIWLLILQAISIHVDVNAETLRSKWVKHTGKKELSVRRDDFTLGNLKNDWKSVISEFVDQIDANTVEDSVKLLNPDFSNVNIDELISCKVTIMDICKNYFEYVIYTLCGFPKVYIYGNKNDWIELKKKTQLLLSNKCEESFSKKWGEKLFPILDEFINVFDGNIKCLFWNSMVKLGRIGGSGGYSYLNGWVNVFFPYIGKANKPNKFCMEYNGEDALGPDINYFPTGLSKAPVSWVYFGKEIPLEFKAGFVGVKQDEKDLTISTIIGWYIETVTENQKNPDENNDTF